MKTTDTEILRYINRTPSLVDLLYELDLLPEQLERDSYRWRQMLILSDWHKRNTDFRETPSGGSPTIVRHGVKLSLAPTSEKALKCQRSATGSDSQPEPHQVARSQEQPPSPTR